MLDRGIDGAQRFLLAAVVIAQDVAGADRVVLQVVALGEFGDARIRQQLAHPLDVQVELDAERHAFGKTAAHRVADRQVDARVQLIYALLELQIGRADLETSLESVGVRDRPQPRRAPRTRPQQQQHEGQMWAPVVHCLVRAA